jgi:hypothetical protein
MKKKKQVITKDDVLSLQTASALLSALAAEAAEYPDFGEYFFDILDRRITDPSLRTLFSGLKPLMSGEVIPFPAMLVPPEPD